MATAGARVRGTTSRARSALEPTPSAGVWERRVLLVEGEPLLASHMVEVLRGAGLEVARVATAVKARELVDDFGPDAALVDVHLGSGPSGLHLAHVLARTHPHVGVLLLSRFADLSSADLRVARFVAGTSVRRLVGWSRVTTSRRSPRGCWMEAPDGGSPSRTTASETENQRRSCDVRPSIRLLGGAQTRA
jgi:CheY-like chemotaxis protein